MLLTVMAQNLSLGGLHDANGDAKDRWPLLAERIASLSPAVDILLLCEVVGWNLYGYKQLARACWDLGMDALPLPPSRSGIGTAALYRKETVGQWVYWNTDCADETLHGFGVAAFDIGLPSPLSVVPVHLTPYDADKAAQEANLIASRGYKYGPYAILAGDINFAPAKGPDPDYSEMRPYNLASRTELVHSGTNQFRPIRKVAETLIRNGYADAAWQLYTKTEDKALLERTSFGDRIDQAWISGGLAPGLVSYEKLGKPVEASDHDGIAIRIDTELADRESPWVYR